MKDRVTGFILGSIISAILLLFLGAKGFGSNTSGEADPFGGGPVGRYRPFGTGVMDTKTGIARTIDISGWREFGEKSNYYITEYNFSEGKVTIWPIETENITSKKVYERLRTKIP